MKKKTEAAEWTRQSSALIWWCNHCDQTDDATMQAWLDGMGAAERMDGVIEQARNPIWLAWILTHMSDEYVEGVLTALRWDAWETARLELGIDYHSVKNDLAELNERIHRVVVRAIDTVSAAKSVEDAWAMQERLCAELRAWCP